MEADYDTPAEIPHQAVLTFKSICAILEFTDKKKTKKNKVCKLQLCNAAYGERGGK